jgi:hypothetical protein
MKVLKIMRIKLEDRPLFVRHWGDVADCMCDARNDNVGNKYIVEVVEKSEREMNDLTGWDGW